MRPYYKEYPMLKHLRKSAKNLFILTTLVLIGWFITIPFAAYGIYHLFH